MNKIPDPNAIFPNEYHTSCFIKNVVSAPNIIVGDYIYYDDADIMTTPTIPPVLKKTTCCLTTQNLATG